MIKYLGKRALYNRVKELSSQIGCKLPKSSDCEYDFYRGDEWLKWDYWEKNGYVKVYANVVPCFDENIGRRITRVYIEDYSFSEDGDEYVTASNTYKFLDTACEYCSIKEKRNIGKWKKLPKAEVHY